MNTIIQQLRANPGVSDYKINILHKESCELFFVKGKLETLRRTETCDKEVTVYVDHNGCKGDAQFFVYPSTTESQLCDLISGAVKKAQLIRNPAYELPGGETGDYTVSSNFDGSDPLDLAQTIAASVFSAVSDPQAALNSVEIFINRYREQVLNSRGLNKTQTRYTAMVEAIPTYNGEQQSVELYQQYNFSNLDVREISREISAKLEEVSARYRAVKPETLETCVCILHKQELAELFYNFAGDLNYASVYTKSNLYHKGDAIQKAPVGDRIGIRMAGQIPGSVRSTCFDGDGMSLQTIRLVEKGKAVNYYGSNRYGQYLNETPTGNLPCLLADLGTADRDAFRAVPRLEILSMSGLQVDFFSDYIGGEVRLAYYHNGETMIPVTGISISGKLSEVLEHIRFSDTQGIHNGYCGPDKAILSKLKIF